MRKGIALFAAATLAALSGCVEELNDLSTQEVTFRGDRPVSIGVARSTFSRVCAQTAPSFYNAYDRVAGNIWTPAGQQGVFVHADYNMSIRIRDTGTRTTCTLAFASNADQFALEQSLANAGAGRSVQVTANATNGKASAPGRRGTLFTLTRINRATPYYRATLTGG